MAYSKSKKATKQAECFAAKLYESLSLERNYYLDRARSCTRLTIPYLIKDSDDLSSDSKEDYPVPWNGIGARGVLNLASRMLLALLPPTQQFFRFSLDEGQLAKEGVTPEERSATEEALSKIERMVLREIEASNDRTVFHEALLHLLVSGNALLYVSSEGLRVFHLNKFVIQRDPMGNPLQAVVAEELAYDVLPDVIKQMLAEEDDDLKGIESDEQLPAKANREKRCRIYTHIKWEGKTVTWHQEAKNKIIPGTEGRSPLDVSPWLPLRMTRVDGASYGVSYVESAALADLQTVEALSQALAESALASSKILFLTKPSGVTKAADLAKAPNGSFVTGDPNDVLALQVQKSQDMSVAMQAKAQIEARLSQAFMLSNPRDAERVTAEEIRLQALEIENSLGSIYSILSSEFQVPYVARKLNILEREGKVPKMDDNYVKVVMTVGLAAIGRGNDLEQLVRFVQTLGQTMGPEALAQYVKPSEMIKRLAYSMGIDIVGLVKSEQELMQEMQQQQQQALVAQAMQGGMADPQKLANAAQTQQDMQMAQEQPPEQP